MRVYTNNAWVWLYSDSCGLYQDISIRNFVGSRIKTPDITESQLNDWLKGSIGVFVEAE